jgi:hypothetical protein
VRAKTTRTTRSLAALLLGLVSIAATPLVALRVELEGLRESGGKTLIELTLQISPEDRARIGRSLSLQAELTRGDTTVGSIARTVEMDAQGRARIQLSWPAGTYHLRVDIESSGGGNPGIWMGEVTIPRFEIEAVPPPEQAAVEPPPEAVSEEKDTVRGELRASRDDRCRCGGRAAVRGSASRNRRTLCLRCRSRDQPESDDGCFRTAGD